jgi:hypothetical protein
MAVIGCAKRTLMKDKKKREGIKKKPSSTMGCRAGEESEYGPAESEEEKGRRSQLAVAAIALRRDQTLPVRSHDRYPSDKCGQLNNDRFILTLLSPNDTISGPPRTSTLLFLPPP